MFKGKIEKKVLSVINNRIQHAEKSHADHCKALDKECEEEIKARKAALVREKEEHAENLVENILGFGAPKK